jgi:hypothetical protein
MQASPDQPINQLPAKPKKTFLQELRQILLGSLAFIGVLAGALFVAVAWSGYQRQRELEETRGLRIQLAALFERGDTTVMRAEARGEQGVDLWMVDPLCSEERLIGIVSHQSTAYTLSRAKFQRVTCQRSPDGPIEASRSVPNL